MRGESLAKEKILSAFHERSRSDSSKDSLQFVAVWIFKNNFLKTTPNDSDVNIHNVLPVV